MSPARIFLSAILLTAFPAFPDDPRTQGRSMVVSELGIAATEHPLASMAAVQVLADGGTAADAAIAANAVMGVVSPMMCGVGGDMFCLVYEAKTGRIHGLNASGWSPKLLTPEFLQSRGYTNMPQAGIHSVTVPGCVAGWALLRERFGSKNFRELLTSAIYYAENGFPVTELDAEYWKAAEEKLRKDATAARVFLPGGRAPKVGEIFSNKDLAQTYRNIASKGRDGFYKGRVAAGIINTSRKLGGTMGLNDLEMFQARWVVPLVTTYRGWRVYEIPPNGQGIAALSMLNIMEQFPFKDFGPNSSRSLHVMIEAKKLAYADMLAHVADPDFAAAPVGPMLSRKYAASRAGQIDMANANAKVAATPTFDGNSDTTYLCVVDKEGNMVSFIQSNYNSFGAGIVPDGCGFALQNRGGLFSLDRSHPNFLQPRKRPLHTIIPGMMENNEHRIAFGIMGGFNQAQAHAQFVSKIADFNLNIQQALDHPRFTKLTFPGCDVELESRFSPELVEELKKLGHDVQLVEPFSQDVGGGQAVMRHLVTGVNYGASDPRKDGAAIPEPPNYKAGGNK